MVELLQSQGCLGNKVKGFLHYFLLISGFWSLGTMCLVFVCVGQDCYLLLWAT